MRIQKIFYSFTSEISVDLIQNPKGLKTEEANKRQLLVYHLNINNIKLASSKTKFINLSDNSRVSIITATGTPRTVNGTINHCSAEASCSGVVVVRHKLAL